MTLHTRTRHLPLAALLVSATAALACSPAVHAAPLDGRLDLAASRYTETPDGALLLSTDSVRLAHQPALVASHCLQVETASGRAAASRTSLVNTCDHALEVSYCIESDEAGALRCSAIGRRGFASVAIAARGRSEITVPAPVGAEVQWVACKSGPDHYSTLTDDGTRGECLVADGPTAIADSTR